MRVPTLAALLALVLLATPAAAQEQSGSISGVVKDASGAVLPGATVEARSPSLIGVRSTVSESDTVTAETPLIDSKASATTASLDSTQIDLIPKGRGLLSVLSQIPGTN